MVEKPGGNLAGAAAAAETAKASASASKEASKLFGLFSSLKKSGSAAVKGGKPAAPVIGKVAGGAGSMLGAAAGKFGAAGAAAQVAGGAIAYKGVEQVTEAAKNISFLMIILGFVHYLLRFTGASGLIYVLSLVLFVLAGYALANKVEKDKVAILIPMLFFVVWYYVYGGRYDLNFLTYFAIAIGTISLIFALFSKGESVKPELLGFVPVLFLFLDIGLLPFLIDKLNWPITPLVESLVLFMPWWAFFGLMTLPSEASKSGTVNFLINLTRIIGILYIISILVIPAVPNLGYDTTKLKVPGAEEFEESQAKLRQKLAGKENPAYSNFVCIWSSPTDINTCVSQRQEASELKAVCKGKDLKEGTTGYEKCLKDEKEKKIKGLQVSGTSDPTIKEPIKAEFKEGTYFQKFFYRQSSTDKISYPIEFKLENPRAEKDKELKVEFECSFIAKLKPKERSIKGKVISSQGSSAAESSLITLTEKSHARTIVCEPIEDGTNFLNGDYRLNYTTRIIGLETPSRLQRLFIGNKLEKWKEENLPKLMSAYFSGQNYLSQSPNDFVRLNFALGDPSENPIIKDQERVFLVPNIENLGSGEIAAITGYQIKTPEGFEIVGSQAGNNCKQGTNVAIPGSKTQTSKVIYLPICQLSVPAGFRNQPEDEYLYQSFEAIVKYDYLIKKELDIKVQTGEEGAAPSSGKVNPPETNVPTSNQPAADQTGSEVKEEIYYYKDGTLTKIK